MIIVSENWKTTWPGAMVGTLWMSGVANPDHHPKLDGKKSELENALRSTFGGTTRAALAALPSIQPYRAYYARYDKTYHVQLQLESIALKKKSFPKVAALVEAMFMAEVKNQLLTAGHDADRLDGSVELDAAQGNEEYVLLNGQPQTLKAGDMFMHDARGVISSVLYGPDQRTRINADTRRVLFVVYAPAGVARTAVEQHLSDLQANVRTIAPAALIESQEIYVAQ